MSRAERHLFVMFRLETYCELYVRKVLLVQRESVLLQLFLPEVRPMGSVRFALKRCQRETVGDNRGCPQMPSRYPWPTLRRRYGPVLACGLPCPTLGRHPGAGPSLGGDVHDRRWLSVNLFLPIAKTCPHFKPAKLIIKWG